MSTQPSPADPTQRPEITAFIGLGSNLPGDVGSPEAQIERACELLEMHPAIRIIQRSRIFATPPWGGVEQSEFRNAVIHVRTTLDPLALLHHCQFAEAVGNRVREVRWGPRTVDVDVLSCFDATLSPIISHGQWGFELVVPHPYAAERAFVLVPWLDLDAAAEPWCVLGERTIAECVADVDEAEVRGIVAVEDPPAGHR